MPIIIDAPFPDDFPESIKKLYPSRVRINNNTLGIMFSTASGNDFWLYAYTSGSEQSGSLKLIDGLWITYRSEGELKEKLQIK